MKVISFSGIAILIGCAQPTSSFANTICTSGSTCGACCQNLSQDHASGCIENDCGSGGHPACKANCARKGNNHHQYCLKNECGISGHGFLDEQTVNLAMARDPSSGEWGNLCSKANKKTHHEGS